MLPNGGDSTHAAVDRNEVEHEGFPAVGCAGSDHYTQGRPQSNAEDGGCRISTRAVPAEPVAAEHRCSPVVGRSPVTPGLAL